MPTNRAGDRTRTGDVHARGIQLQSDFPSDTRELHGKIPPRNTRNAPKAGNKCANNVQPTDTIKRIRARVEVDANGCWIWMGATSSRGYGQIKVGRQVLAVHRAVAEATYGEIGAGLMALHHCDVKRCCRPDHLYVGSARQNIGDAIARGRFPFAAQALQRAKTTCVHGHPFDEDNTLLTSRGTRHCRQCATAKGRRRYRARLEAIALRMDGAAR